MDVNQIFLFNVHQSQGSAKANMQHNVCTMYTLNVWFEYVYLNDWIQNHMPRNKWDEITYAFPNFDGATVEGHMFSTTMTLSPMAIWALIRL